MGYLDNSSITVDAVLTKKGREILKDGGNLNINSFTLSDTGVDYSLWNSDHPDGTAFYGEAIENLPMLEASVHAEYNLRNRLLTLPQNTIAIPVLILGGSLVDKATNTIVFNDGDQDSGDVNASLHNFTSSNMIGKYVVVQDPSIVHTNLQGGSALSGTSRMFLQEQDIPFAMEYELRGDDFKIIPLQQTETNKQTLIYIVDRETGAYDSLRVTNNITRSLRASQSRRVIG